MEITYSDFQADQGLLLPRREIHRCDGQEVMKITIESITLNPTVDPAWFKKT